MLNMLYQNHTYNTRAATCNLIDITQVPRSHFGKSSIRLKTSQTWNELQRSLNMVLLNCGVLRNQYFKHTFPTIAMSKP